MEQITSDEALIKWRVATSNVQRLEGKEKTLTEQIATIEQNTVDWNGAKTLLELLKNYKLEKRKDFILSVINSALMDIFESNYRLDIQPREAKGKSAASTQKYDIIFFQNDIEIARNNDLLTSNGGGVLSIASLFFKILIGYLYSKNKFYIFDEALSQVSPQYRQRLSRFLREFCEKYGFTLVVVSQTEELEEHAHLVYEVDSSLDKNDIPVLNIVNTLGDFPDEDFFYSRIKNFQSVVDQTFIYKGFTIVRGPNNSGKSATLRAIDALIFNNFKVDNYPRKNPGGGALTTDISFGYQGKKGQPPKEIGLKYKSGKVMFVIDGQEYFGKSLAADKLKEAVEKIGFRYIDVKKMYKNFKGALKEQTERIAYTNQYDGLFLIGSKATDSEKIFSFLFNTENIALAIAQSKEAMLEFSKDFKTLQLELQEVQEELRRVKINVDYFIKIYYLMLIQEYQSSTDGAETLEYSSKLLEDMLSRIETFISSTESGLWLQQNNTTITELRNKVEYNNIQSGLIEQIIGVADMTNLINGYIDLETATQEYSKKLETIDQLVPRFQSLMTFGYFDELTHNINIKRQEVSTFDNARNNLDLHYSLCECNQCQGLGVTPS